MANRRGGYAGQIWRWATFTFTAVALTAVPTVEAIKNLFGEELKPCVGAKNSDFQTNLCTETGQKVHGVCVIGLPADWSTKTDADSSWSTLHKGKNYCASLGELAYYVAAGGNPDIQCRSIPSYVFEHAYHDNWGTWGASTAVDDDRALQGVQYVYKECRTRALARLVPHTVEAAVGNLDTRYAGYQREAVRRVARAKNAASRAANARRRAASYSSA